MNASPSAHQRQVQQYIERYAESESKHSIHHPSTLLPTATEQQNYQQALVIPAFAESTRCLAQVLQQIPGDQLQQTLLIVVVNAPTDARQEQLNQTLRLLSALSEGLQDSRQLAPTLSVGMWQTNSNRQSSTRLVLVDRCSTAARRLSPQQGVGLARKIGADIALAWLHVANPNRASWIYNTDADATLPVDYFSRPLPPAAAVCLPFSHHSSNAELLALARLYEAHMARYVDGLREARSPYAYHSMGSATVINTHHYAQVRGFPKRNAGEDFHLLNKLAKTGKVASVQGAPILLAARLSNRVPFGTGPALAKLQDAQAGMTTYPDQAFGLLKEALATCLARCHDQTLSPSDSCTRLLGQIDPQGQMGNLMKASPAPQQRVKALHQWFDGLKTLQFIRLASGLFPPQNLGR